ncbi:L-rhamnose mutarotase [Nocardioides alkalitolerans]|uniref:L-rhamnose mutarotase n=1 Tax=Nocardioides alkalitolerans TaxID=281714 RepID=UPI0004004D9F|nr:L-rhamnose mutarotase [Nocardioides alkalitolerans]
MSLRAAVLLSTLRAGHEQAYDADHAVVPDPLLDLLVAHGVRDWVIWRDGRSLLHLVDVDDYEVLGAAIADDAVNVAWQADMAAHVEAFETIEAVPALEQPRLVWSLRRQAAAAPVPEPFPEPVPETRSR